MAFKMAGNRRLLIYRETVILILYTQVYELEIREAKKDKKNQNKNKNENKNEDLNEDKNENKDENKKKDKGEGEGEDKNKKNNYKYYEFAIAITGRFETVLKIPD